MDISIEFCCEFVLLYTKLETAVNAYIKFI